MKLLSTILLVWAALAFLACCFMKGAHQKPSEWI